MPGIPFRRGLAIVLLASAALAAGSCRDQPEGTVRVVLIDDAAPELVDPALAPVSPADAVLLSNVAQGLVSFDASGNIVAGLAERWNVSDDGLSYIFRLAASEWSNGQKITAHQVARVIKRQLGARSRNPMKDTLGAIGEVVAMTDRVIEIRLLAPRPNLLPLLAAPELAIIRNGHGSGPFAIAETSGEAGELRLQREIAIGEDEASRDETILLAAAQAQEAVRRFAAGTTDLVLGGTFVDLPFARRVRLSRNAIRFDPASGLFGLMPTSDEGPFAERDVRRLLNQAIDRQALVAAMGVPGLAARATVLEPGLDALPAPVQPAWFGVPVAERRPTLLAEARRLFGAGDKPIVRLQLPEGPGADMLLRRLAADWGALGFRVERASSPRSADFRLIDAVAPATSAAWFLRNFRCEVAAVCDEEVDSLLQAAREAPVPAQRFALLFQAAGRIDDGQLYMPLAAPIRWSLVADGIVGFAGNRYARHTLSNLEQVAGGD